MQAQDLTLFEADALKGLTRFAGLGDVDEAVQAARAADTPEGRFRADLWEACKRHGDRVRAGIV